jgi:hypothetical protein
MNRNRIPPTRDGKGVNPLDFTRIAAVAPLEPKRRLD